MRGAGSSYRLVTRSTSPRWAVAAEDAIEDGRPIEACRILCTDAPRVNHRSLRERLLQRMATLDFSAVLPTTAAVDALLRSMHTLRVRDPHHSTVRLLGEVERLADAARPRPRAGRVLLPLQRRRAAGRLVGLVRVLEVRSELSARRVITLQVEHQLGEAARAAFSTAVDAVSAALGSFGLDDLDAVALRRSLGATGTIRALADDLDGGSLGLGAAMAMLSDLLELRVPEDLAFSGTIDARGACGRVSLEAKLVELPALGIRRTLVGAGSVVDGAPDELAVQPVDSLVAACRAVFDATALERALAGLARRARSAEHRWNAKLETTVDAASPTRDILISMVGRSDPFGTSRDPLGSVVSSADGPLLTMARHFHPARILLAFTASGEPHNDFRGKAESAANVLAATAPASIVERQELHGVTNPVDYEQIVEPMRQLVGAAAARIPGVADRVVINVTSGTPQMYHCWWEVRREFPDTPIVFYRVNEERFAVDRPRVERVTYPFRADAGRVHEA